MYIYIYSDILSGMYSDIGSDTISGILSGNKKLTFYLMVYQSLVSFQALLAALWCWRPGIGTHRSYTVLIKSRDPHRYRCRKHIDSDEYSLWTPIHIHNLWIYKYDIYIYRYLDLQTPRIFWSFWLFANSGRGRLFFFGIVIKNWNAPKPWKLEKKECFNIFFPSPSNVSSISWGCTVVHWGGVCGSDSATPPTFSYSKHFCTESAKSPQKNDQNIPQKSAKRPQKPAKRPQIRKTGCLVCFYTQ